MIQINLLPWREQTRKLKKTRFIFILGVSVGLTLFIILCVHMHFNHIVGNQEDLNEYLKAQISEQQTASSATTLQGKEKNDIEAQLNFIISLRKKNYDAVRLLNELITLVPNTVLINKIIRNGSMITLGGLAQSDSQVTVFLQNISKSSIFNQPTLTKIKEGAAEGEKTEFLLNAEQKG